MKFLICLCMVSFASAGVMNLYANDGGSGGGGSGYGTRTERRCSPYFDTIEKNHCESYTERTCTTTQREACTDIGDQNCRAVVSSKQVRKCFNVTEQRCSLKEDVQFDTIQVPIVVQKCTRVNERVCDTVYDTSRTSNEQSECINVENPQCNNVENTVYDRTCRTTTTFDCDTTYPTVYANQGSSGSVQVDAYGNQIGGGSGSGSGSGSGGAGDYGSSDSGYGSTVSPYGQPKPNCRRNQDSKCYKTPRTVTVQQCSRRTDRICEKLSESVPFVEAKQSCRNEEKKVCDLEERSQPKQVKKYVYSKQCSAVPRVVCENADQKSLVPSCVGVTRKQCTYSPVESCEDEPKQHCFTYSFKIQRQRCETVTIGNANDGSSSISSGNLGGSISGSNLGSSLGGSNLGNLGGNLGGSGGSGNLGNLGGGLGGGNQGAVEY